MELLQSVLEHYNVLEYLTHNYTIYFLLASCLTITYKISGENVNLETMSLQNKTGVLSTRLLDLEKRFKKFKDQSVFTLNMLSQEQNINCDNIQKLKGRISNMEEMCYSE